ncbi:MAG: glycosyltransferase family 39 protein [Bacteroidales bacterium]|nr:glycosyltransferase family 39 protein [Bacteroidales bacterium]
MKQTRWLLLFALIVLLLPWLGETLFSAKGEPREAIVAMSMLESGNWILPVSYGADMPYKPPLLAWLIAIASWLFNGGVVNEFTSRLPSAIAAIAMVMTGYSWALRVTWRRSAVIMSVVTITSFEVYRAAVTCRVDMLLTAFMVIALFEMYRWRQYRDTHVQTPGRSLTRLLWIALLLSGAVLSKGPIGSLLPCLAMGVFCLVRGDNFFRTLIWLGVMCILSFLLPSLWYWQAYQQGGQEFLNLALQENVQHVNGPFTYDVHLTPWWYNLWTMAIGLLPWTLLLLMVFIASCFNGVLGKALKNRKAWSEPTTFAVTVSSVIFLFYCLPAGKHSAYLLPLYPFLAYGVAELIGHMQRQGSLKLYCYIIFGLAVIAPIIGVILQWVPIENVPVESMPLWRYPLALIPLLGAWLWFHEKKFPIRNLMITTLLMFLAAGSAFMPMFLNARSDLKGAVKVELASRDHGPVFTYTPDSLRGYYTLNFYLNDKLRRIQQVNTDTLSRFVLLTSPEDFQAVALQHPDFAADTTHLLEHSCDTHGPIVLSRFHRTNQ